MKTYIVYLVIGLVAINSLSAQVKIGDNPQNLNPASLLELQSSNRVLVITRVTDAQMSGISPLPGAVVYNTDQGCLHYYNGTEWINICEELDNSFTVSTRADSLQQVNPNARDNTIAILESINPDGSTNYNFEVNRITGANIVDTSINGSTKLQNESVTNNKLAEKSVGLRNLADATNTGDLLMYNGTAWNFVNRTDLLNTQLDSIVGNEYNTGSGISGGIITITDGGGDLNTNLISTDTGNNITAGIDGALFFSETLTMLTDNADGTLTYTPENGTPQTFDARTATVLDNTDGTFTITDDFGTTVNIDTNETLTTLTDNADGTLTYTPENGTPQTFDARTATVLDNTDGTFTITDDFGTTVNIDTNETLTTLTDNADGTLTYTPENGTPQTFDARTATVLDNTDGTFTITDDFGTTVNIDTNETLTTLTDNADGTLTYTPENGTPQTFDARTATVLDNTDGTFTITDDFGTTVNIDTNETLTTLTDNADGTLTYTPENGTPQTFDARTATVLDNTDGTFTITDDFGTTVNIDTNETLTTLTDNTDGTLTYTPENGTPQTFDARTATVLDNTDGTFTITDDFGTTVNIDTNETLTTIVQDAAAGTVTYTDEDGADTVLNTTTQPIDFTNTDRTLTNTNYTLILQSGGTFTSGVTLPDPAMTPFGKIFVIRNNSGGQVNIVNPILTSPFPPLNNNEAIWVQTDGNDWYQIN